MRSDTHTIAFDSKPWMFRRAPCTHIQNKHINIQHPAHWQPHNAISRIIVWCDVTQRIFPFLHWNRIDDIHRCRLVYILTFLPFLLQQFYSQPQFISFHSIQLHHFVLNFGNCTNDFRAICATCILANLCLSSKFHFILFRVFFSPQNVCAWMKMWTWNKPINKAECESGDLSTLLMKCQTSISIVNRIVDTENSMNRIVCFAKFT